MKNKITEQERLIERLQSTAPQWFTCPSTGSFQLSFNGEAALTSWSSVFTGIGGLFCTGIFITRSSCQGHQFLSVVSSWEILTGSLDIVGNYGIPLVSFDKLSVVTYYLRILNNYNLATIDISTTSLSVGEGLRVRSNIGLETVILSRITIYPAQEASLQISGNMGLKSVALSHLTLWFSSNSPGLEVQNNQGPAFNLTLTQAHAYITPGASQKQAAVVVSQNQGLHTITLGPGVNMTGDVQITSNSDLQHVVLGPSVNTTGDVQITGNPNLQHVVLGPDFYIPAEQRLFVSQNLQLRSVSFVSTVDAETVAFPGSLSVHHAVTGLSIPSFVGLGSVGGDLQLIVSASTLNGLEQIEAVGGSLTVKSSAQLVNLTGLDGLTSVAGALVIQSNANLESLTGLQALNSIGGLDISVNPRLADLDALSGLTKITGNVIMSGNSAFLSLEGLDQVTQIHGTLSITLSVTQSHLDFLPNLACVTAVASCVNCNATTVARFRSLSSCV